MTRLVLVRAGGALLAFAGVAVLGGCAGQLSEADQRQLLAAYQAYDAGDDQAVISKTSTFLWSHRFSGRAGEAYYLRGLSKERAGDRRGARSDLTLAADRTGSDEVRAKAALALGDMCWADGDLPAACGHYRRCMKLVRPPAPPSQQAMFRLGRVLQRQGEWAQADAWFGRAIQHFGGTAEADQARLRIGGRAWTIQAGAFADESGARKLVLLLAKKSLAARIEAVARGSGTIHAVRIGRYDTYRRAEAALEGVRRHCSDAFITVSQ